ncbi:IS1 family transposase [Escherichia coli]
MSSYCSADHADDLVGNVFNRQKFLVICWYLRFSVATATVHCSRCNSDEVYRHGRSWGQFGYRELLYGKPVF